MTEEELTVAANKLRLHIKADEDLSRQIGAIIGEASKRANLDLPYEFYEGLVIVHQSEMDSAFSVTILPVGSQCGL